MVIDTSSYGTSKGTAIITRAKTGAREYYKGGKLEIIESTRATNRINPITGQSEQWIELEYTPAGEVSYATGEAISQTKSEKEGKITESINYTTLPIKSTGVIGEPKSTIIETRTAPIETTPQMTPRPSDNIVSRLRQKGYLPPSVLTYRPQAEVEQEKRDRSFNYGYGKYQRPILSIEGQKERLSNVKETYKVMGKKAVQEVPGLFGYKSKKEKEYIDVIAVNKNVEDNFALRGVTAFANNPVKGSLLLAGTTAIAPALTTGVVYGTALTGGAETTTRKIFETKAGAKLTGTEDIFESQYQAFKESGLAKEYYYNALLSGIEKGKDKSDPMFSKQNIRDFAGKNILVPLTSKEAKQKGFEYVKEYAKSQGYNEQQADTLRKMTYRYYTEQWGSELSGYVAGGAISNKMAGRLLPLAEQSASKVGLTGTKKFLTSRTMALAPAGAFEGIAYTEIGYRKKVGRKAEGKELLFGGAVGAVSAPLIQIGIESPARAMKGKPFVQKVGKYASSKGVETFAYVTDPIEAWGDVVDYASQQNIASPVKKSYNALFKEGFTVSTRKTKYEWIPKSKVRTMSQGFTTTRTSTRAETKKSSDNILKRAKAKIERGFESPTKIKTKTLSLVKSRPSTQLDISPKTQPKPEPIINPETKTIIQSNTFPLTRTSTNPLTNPRTNPFTNTKTNVNPRTNPFTNTFVGKVPPLLFLPGGSGTKKGYTDYGLQKKRKKKYTPSLTATVFNIKGKKNILGEISGIGIRPIEK